YREQLDPSGEADYIKQPYEIGVAVRFDHETPITAADVAEGVARGMPDHETLIGGTVHIGPGGGEEWHEHPSYYEIVLYVQSGRLAIGIEQDGRREASEAGPGDFVRIPPRARHRWINESNEDVQLVWWAHY